MTQEADLLAALYELSIAAEAFRCDPTSAELGVALVHALERYDPEPSSLFYFHFSIARDGLIRDMINLFPDAFPWPVIAS